MAGQDLCDLLIIRQVDGDISTLMICEETFDAKVSQRFAFAIAWKRGI